MASSAPVRLAPRKWPCLKHEKRHAHPCASFLHVPYKRIFLGFSVRGFHAESLIWTFQSVSISFSFPFVLFVSRPGKTGPDDGSPSCPSPVAMSSPISGKMPREQLRAPLSRQLFPLRTCRSVSLPVECPPGGSRFRATLWEENGWEATEQSPPAPIAPPAWRWRPRRRPEIEQLLSPPTRSLSRSTFRSPRPIANHRTRSPRKPFASHPGGEGAVATPAGVRSALSQACCHLLKIRKILMFPPIFLYGLPHENQPWARLFFSRVPQRTRRSASLPVESTSGRASARPCVRETSGKLQKNCPPPPRMESHVFTGSGPARGTVRRSPRRRVAAGGAWIGAGWARKRRTTPDASFFTRSGRR